MPRRLFLRLTVHTPQSNILRENQKLTHTPFPLFSDSKTPSKDEVAEKAQGAKQEVNHKLGQAAGKARDAKEEVEKKI